MGSSDYLPTTLAEPGDHINASAEGGDNVRNVDTRDFAVIDLGYAGL